MTTRPLAGLIKLLVSTFRAIRARLLQLRPDERTHVQ
jgi:hypothetical protein